MSEKRTLVVVLALTVVAIAGTALLMFGSGGGEKAPAPPVVAQPGGPIIRPLGAPSPPPDAPPPDMQLPPPVMPPPADAVVHMPPPAEPEMDLPTDPAHRAEAIEKRLAAIDHDLERVREQMQGEQSKEEMRKELIQLLRQRTSLAREARQHGLPVRPVMPHELKGFRPRHDVIDPAAPPNR